MAIRTHLIGLGATHLFMLNDTNQDAGSLGSFMSAAATSGSFVATPMCEGVVNSYQSIDSASKIDGLVFSNEADVNTSVAGAYGTGTRTLCLWSQTSEVDDATCIYEQGGGTNNFAFIAGIGGVLTWQAADSGQPFLIARSQVQAQENRPYFFVGVWEHHSQHAGSGNRIIFYLNGVEQQEVELTGTQTFPNHSGDITVGNNTENLQSYGGGQVGLNAYLKNANMLGMYNNVSWSEADARDVFERSVLPTVTISADTVANQQAALDALIGNSYADVNCAIRIEQATDETNYRLFIDNINFQRVDEIRDIHVQYVGPNFLIIENTNGSNVYETSVPVEVDQSLDGSSILTGGGFIIMVEDTTRFFTPTTVVNPQNTKMVVETVGTYTIDGGVLSTFENVSGGAVTLNVTGGASIPTIVDTDGTTTVLSPVTIQVTVTDTSGAPIENARVLVRATETKGTITSGDTLLTGLTNASGVVETSSFNFEAAFSGSLAVNIRARQGSVSPYKKPGEAAGVISNTGFSTIIALLADE